MATKPPLGLMPEWRHKELRLAEIREAVQRYLDAKEAVPVNWIVEEYCLREWLENREEEKKQQPPSGEEQKDTPKQVNQYVDTLEAVADILSRVYHYGNFKIETPNERVIAGLLNELCLFPTSEENIIARRTWNKYYEKYKSWSLPSTTPSNKASEHPEDYCKKCGHPNPCWYAGNELWNKVMKGEKHGIVCPVCFQNKADEIGINTILKAMTVSESVEHDSQQEKSTPSEQKTEPLFRTEDLVLAFNAGRKMVHSGSGTEISLEKVVLATLKDMAAYTDADDYIADINMNSKK